MRAEILEDCAYSHDKVNITKLKKNEVVNLPSDIFYKFVGRGLCRSFTEVRQCQVFNPIEEVKEVEPVIKKKRGRKKKVD